MTQQQQSPSDAAKEPMPLSQMTRDELYAHLRTTTKDAVVLQEMRRLGFWPASTGKPTQTEEVIAREAELATTLRDLYAKLSITEHDDPRTAYVNTDKAMFKTRYDQIVAIETAIKLRIP